MRTSTSPTRTRLLTLTLSGLMMPVMCCAADIVFSETFDGDTSDLDGKPVDIGTGNWVAAASFNQDGVFDNASGAGSATLTFAPVDGKVYTLDASISGVQNSDNDWFGLGFVKGQSNSTGTNFRFLTAQVLGRAWMLFRADRGTNHASMNGTADHVAWNTAAFDVAGIDIDLRIVLDTTGGAGAWAVTWSAKAAADASYTVVRPSAALLTEDIDSVGLAYSNNRIDGTITRFVLTESDGGADTEPPVLVGTSPSDNASEAPIGGDLVADFNEVVQAGAGGAIVLHRASDDSVVETFDLPASPRVSFGGGSVTIDPTADLVAGVEYYVLIDSAAIEDTSNNGFAGIDDPEVWSFTADATAPAKVAMTPAGGATDAPPGGTISLSFGEPVVAGAGAITIHLAADGSVVQNIDVNSAAVVINGAVVTITPPAQLAGGTNFYINIAAGTFADLSGNPFAGVLDSSSWTFATAVIPEGLLFSHEFGGDATDLDGTLPDVTTGGASWVASPNFNQDGSIDQGAGSATVAFTPFDGLVYTLDASLRGVSGDQDWFALGFGKGQSTGSTGEDRFIQNNLIGKAWMLFRGNDNGHQAFLGSATAGTADGSPWGDLATVTGEIDLRIVLDTTGGAGNWTATWFAKRPEDAEYTEVRATTPLLSEDIDSVGLALSNTGVFGSIESFRLFTGAEPSERFEITEIVYSEAGSTVSLTWDARPAETYVVKFSIDLSNWDGDLDDSITLADDEIPDDGDKITVSFDLAFFGLDAVEQLFFRVEK